MLRTPRMPTLRMGRSSSSIDTLSFKPLAGALTFRPARVDGTPMACEGTNAEEVPRELSCSSFERAIFHPSNEARSKPDRGAIGRPPCLADSDPCAISARSNASLLSIGLIPGRISEWRSANASLPSLISPEPPRIIWVRLEVRSENSISLVLLRPHKVSRRENAAAVTSSGTKSSSTLFRSRARVYASSFDLGARNLDVSSSDSLCASDGTMCSRKSTTTTATSLIASWVPSFLLIEADCA
mmetsp:Transcript_7218/g.19762  ORF Transcript_7218/g.19762 Transcript_7218/m.19762 type:complete len:242 (+) Transcript_7218:2332-3057(+)